jgi:phosphate/sulfate permease
MIDIHAVTFAVIFAGLLGAIIWDLITWYWGLPTSSSHALIGGYAGAAVTKAGFSVIIPSGWTKRISPTRRSVWARFPAGGVSFTRWGRGSPSCNR